MGCTSTMHAHGETPAAVAYLAVAHCLDEQGPPSQLRSVPRSEYSAADNTLCAAHAHTTPCIVTPAATAAAAVEAGAQHGVSTDTTVAATKSQASPQASRLMPYAREQAERSRMGTGLSAGIAPQGITHSQTVSYVECFVCRPASSLVPPQQRWSCCRAVAGGGPRSRSAS